MAAIAVTLGQNTETLERADDVFDQNTFLRQGAIGFFLGLGQGMELGVFGWHRRVGVFLLQALIT